MTDIHPDVRSTALVMGPSRVGKTTLITALVDQAEQSLRRSPVSIEPADDKTRLRIRRNSAELSSDLAVGEFQSGTLQGTTDVSRYELVLRAEDVVSLQLTLVDFPGGWIHLERSEHDARRYQEEVQPALRDASVMVVPIDATVLMEAATPEEKRAAPHLLEIEAVREAAVEWAKLGRGKRRDLMLVPVKCESYFTDNGGRRDASEKLFDLVTRYYGPLVEAVRSEDPSVRMTYAPVDTVGVVEVERVTWKAQGGEILEPEVTFIVRANPGQPVSRRVAGVDAVLAPIVRPLLDEQHADQQRVSSQREKDRAEAQKEVDKKRGLFEKVWDFVTDEKSKRKKKLKHAEQSNDEARAILDELTEAVLALASSTDGPRVRSLG